jgi:hypothetical protein
MQSEDLIPASEVKRLLGGVCDRTIRRYRSNYWHRGIHYTQPVQRVMYVRPMIVDWILHRQEPGQHQAAMEAWLAANQPPKTRKKSS